jgi:hypothetical protein
MPGPLPSSLRSPCGSGSTKNGFFQWPWSDDKQVLAPYTHFRQPSRSGAGRNRFQKKECAVCGRCLSRGTLTLGNRSERAAVLLRYIAEALKLKKSSSSHRWFAWRPVFISDRAGHRRLVWLRHIAPRAPAATRYGANRHDKQKTDAQQLGGTAWASLHPEIKLTRATRNRHISLTEILNIEWT